jgi:primosomal protein N' (replication factor Y)
MLAEILIPRGARETPAHVPLFTYRVPERLAAHLAPGQLVAVPFGERASVGIIWELNAADEVELSTPLDAQPDHSLTSLPTSPALREIQAILMPEPALLPVQRAFAEWISEYYVAPLGSAARLFFPAGLLRSVRLVLRPVTTSAPPGTEIAAGAGMVPGDEGAVLALLRERGWLEHAQVVEALGAERARAVIRRLRRLVVVTLAAEIPAGFLRARKERRVRLLAAPDAVEGWRADARAALDDGAARVVVASHPRRGQASPRDRQAQRQTERVLRQLAVLDVLARHSRDTQAATSGDGGLWRLEELRRLTRATTPLLTELQAAGLIAIEEGEVRHDPLAGRAITRTTPLSLTPAQRAALAAIVAALPGETEAGQRGIEMPAHGTGDGLKSAGEVGARTFLLHGITGSGKTEVYLQALAAALARGRRGIVLVPEIALTPQAMARYAGRFPGRLALLHSGLTDAERLDEWRRIRAGEVDIVLGSRSALFAPVERLGLIVVDEEHEGAYKQDRTPTYSARDAAVRLGLLSGAAVVLGSATPSIESYWLATQGTYTLLELRERPDPSPGLSSTEGEEQRLPIIRGVDGLPPVTVVDLRAELRAGNTSILSESLRAALQETLDRGEQAILFLNRRGTASSVVCRECGYVVRCGNCDVSMTYHAGEHVMICHYCGKRQPEPALCPVCRGGAIRYFGLGTERVETAVKRQFPGARVLRWDRDTARTRQAHEELLRAFAERRADVLVGTQMIAKGLDLPAVTLVGVVSADIALFLPDFRASERAFQLLTQVAGRAGRGERPGRVLVQTFNPEHFCIQTAARHDYAAFAAAELDARQRYDYPPLRRFARLTYAHRDRYTALVGATALAERLECAIAELGLTETDLVGPAPAFLERLRGRYRWQVLVRAPDPRPLLHAVQAEGPAREWSLREWSLDVDPASTL